MASYYPIATIEQKSRDDTYTLTVERLLESEPSVVELEAERGLAITYGSPSSYESAGAMPSSMLQHVHDDGTIQDALDAVTDDKEIQVKLTSASGTYYWDGYLALGSIQRRRYGKADPIRMEFYDGLSHRNSYQHSVSDVTFSLELLFRRAIKDYIRSWPIQYAIEWQPRNWVPDDATDDDVLAADLRFSLPKGLVSNLPDQLVRDFNARLFQPLMLNAKWRFQQAHTIGKAVAQRNFSEDALRVSGGLAANAVSITDDDVDWDAMNVMNPRRVTERFMPPFPNNASYVVTIVDGDFEYWVDDAPMAWEFSDADKYTALFYSGASSVRLLGSAGPYAYVRQPAGFVTLGQELYPYVAFRARALSVSSTQKYRFRIDPENASDDTYYSTSGGGWSTTPQWQVTGTVTTSTWSSHNLVLTSPVPVTGLLWIEFEGGATDSLLDAVQVRTHSSEVVEPQSTFGSVVDGVFQSRRLSSESRPYSEYSTNITDPGLWVRSTFERVIPDWPVAGWVDESSAEFSYLHELAARKRLARANNPGYEGLVYTIVAPEQSAVLGGTHYIAESGCHIDLLEKTTKAYWVPR